ncbi:type VI secretion system-associated protein TagO [Vibrio cholerae]|nr:type VI secretion system-associated protein TagO [Vibrio cholerae]EGR4457854.1 type VI secretion system-associated protein TagO [Vibrio cholerae]EGR5446699.1 type VI secretion system-associated protein TagO [Vibrio cholerae]EGR5456440.1 type VI secretion system-associated protein TagO [Vibrio cholerae]EGR5464003.1 type VI secretion system-associated protein TagO [Vibrio cholerae]
MPKIGDQNPMRITVLVASLILGCAGSAHVLAASQDAGSQVEQAELCREIPARLERLACFDRVFATPLEQVAIAPSNPYPAEWQRAMAALSESQSEAGWVLGTQGEGRGSSAWIALPAQNRSSGETSPPVLLLSCINNLSRIELALPKEVADARIQVSIRHETQFWRSDDHGVLFSSARGMPAIEMMKLAASESRLLLRSNAPFADGLQFDTRGVNEALDALRERCGW